MKKIFVFALSLLTVFFCSCKEKCVPQDMPIDFERQYSVDVIDPVKYSFIDGVYRVDFDIKSDIKGDAFIWLMLLQWREDEIPLDVGSDVHVYGFQIRAYHQTFDCTGCEEWCYNDIPTMKFPIFMKKINLPQNTSIHETIDFRLSDGFSHCLVKMFLFRTNNDIEETMKTKLNPENFGSDCHFDKYYNCFPDSSLFSYLMTNDFCPIVQLTKPTGYKVFTMDCKKYQL